MIEWVPYFVPAVAVVGPMDDSVLASAIGYAVVGVGVALWKNRSRTVWGFACALGGVAGLVVLLVIPSEKPGAPADAKADSIV